MNHKTGAIIYVDRGYQVAEVLEDRDGLEPHFVGYRLIGEGADETLIYTREDDAIEALAQLAGHQPRPELEP